MMTSSIGNIFCVPGPLCGEFIGHRWIPPQRPVTRSFGVFFDLRLNKWLNKQSWSWWFETPSRSLWRHYNAAANFSETMAIKNTNRFCHENAFEDVAASNAGHFVQALNAKRIKQYISRVYTHWSFLSCSRDAATFCWVAEFYLNFVRLGFTPRLTTTGTNSVATCT